MRKVLPIIFLTLSVASYSQEGDTLFSDFLKDFYPQQLIKPKYLVKFFDYDPESLKSRMNFSKRYTKQIVKRDTSYILITVRYECVAGGMCSALELYSFTTKGQPISKIDLNKNIGDCSFTKSTESLIFENDIVVTKSIDYETDCETDETTKEVITIKQYIVNKDGQIGNTHSKAVDTRRAFKEVSIQKFTELDVSKYSLNELATMRNELFASYGYTFKSARWKDYFETQEWYNPTKEEVKEEDLTEVEKSNLELIQKAESILK